MSLGQAGGESVARSDLPRPAVGRPEATSRPPQTESAARLLRRGVWAKCPRVLEFGKKNLKRKGWKRPYPSIRAIGATEAGGRATLAGACRGTHLWNRWAEEPESSGRAAVSRWPTSQLAGARDNYPPIVSARTVQTNGRPWGRALIQSTNVTEGYGDTPSRGGRVVTRAERR